MDPARGFANPIKMEYMESPPPAQNKFLIPNPLQVVPSLPKYSNQFSPLLLQSQPVSEPSGSPCLVTNNLQSLQPCAFIVNEPHVLSRMTNEANTFSHMSNSPIGDVGRNLQAENTMMQFPSSSSYPPSELGKIVRPASPTQQCRIQERDKDHIGHILMETTAKDSIASESVCALSAKTLYLSNSGAVISTIDLPYYWCNFCTFKTEQKLILLNHLMSHRFWCKWCRYQAYSRADVVRHCMTNHPQHSQEDLKFCVLLPDFLLSKMESEKTCDSAQNSNKRENLADCESLELNARVQGITEKENKENTVVSSQAVKVDKVLDFVTGILCEESVETDKEKPTGKSKRSETKNCQRKRNLEDNNQSLESQTVKCSNVPSVCFECCTCHFRTLQKEFVERHQAEVNHYKTDKTTGKKTFVLKIVSSLEKLKVEKSDKEWISEREESTRRSKRRAKQVQLKSSVTDNIAGAEFHNFISSEFDDDDYDVDDDNDNDNDEDYDPDKVDGKKKGSIYKKKKLARSYKVVDPKNSEISDVGIEIDTAGEPSGDIGVTSFSISCVNTADSDHTFKISPKKIVTRNLYQNCIVTDPSIVQYKTTVPVAIKKEIVAASVTSSNPQLKKETVATSVTYSNPQLVPSLSCGPLKLQNQAKIMEAILTRSGKIGNANDTTARLVSTSHSTSLAKVTATDTVPPNHILTSNPLPYFQIAARNNMQVNIGATEGAKASIPTPVSTVNTAPVPQAVTSTVAALTTQSLASTVTATSSQTRPAEESTSGKSQQQEVCEGNSKIIISKKGVFKCAHCRVVGDRVLQIRLHILEKHKDNPLYCLDMEATDGKSPRYLLFCHFTDCTFCTKSRNSFLTHVNSCKHDKGDAMSETEKRFKEVNLKFVRSTFPKLVKIAK